jgi:hypothetical protein
VLASGERGDAVARLQLALIAAGQSLPVSTAQQSQLPDGIFGGESLSAVRGFQSEHALKVDGIVGKNTLEKLDRALPTTRKAGCCSNGQQGNAERAMSFIGGANFRAAVAGGLAGITLPSSVRFLDAAQEAAARSVYGTRRRRQRLLLPAGQELPQLCGGTDRVPGGERHHEHRGQPVRTTAHSLSPERDQPFDTALGSEWSGDRDPLLN